jgi:hypothetical protein
MFYRQKMDMTSVTNQNMIKSVFCRSVTGEGGCLAVGGRCRFAHTINELRPRLCKYRDRCNKHKDHPKTCKFVHPDEDIYDYSRTHGFLADNIDKPDAVRRNIAVDFSYSEDDWPDLETGKSNNEDTNSQHSEGYDSIDGVNWKKAADANGNVVVVHSI